jgi:hypothetical protein
MHKHTCLHHKTMSCYCERNRCELARMQFGCRHFYHAGVEQFDSSYCLSPDFICAGSQREQFYQSESYNEKIVTSRNGRDVVEAVSRRLPAAAARDQAQVKSFGTCGGQSRIRAGFLRVFRFPSIALQP